MFLFIANNHLCTALNGNLVDKNYNSDYWENRWQNDQTGWDIGYASPPITKYFDQVDQMEAEILIPGCGNAWEGEYLFNKGFKNVFLLDIAVSAVRTIQHRMPQFPNSQILIGDFFNHAKSYDYIIEQTFFCALSPELRPVYAHKAASLLKPNGTLVGLLFDTEFGNDHPPFGGTRDEYWSYFNPHFEIVKMEPAVDSIKPRRGNELFIEMKKR